MSDDFRVPFVSNIPVEVETEMNKRISADISYTKIKENKISKTYNNKKPTRIRRTRTKKNGTKCQKKTSKNLKKN